MADTIRTRSSILTLFADNTAGDISPQDLRDFVVSAHGVYGAIYGGSTTAFAINSSTGSATRITNSTNSGPSAGTTLAPSTGKITVGTDGVYQTHFTGSFRGSTGEEYTFEVFKNSTQTGFKFNHQATQAPNAAVSITGLHSLSANDELTVRVVAGSTGLSITMPEWQLSAYRVA